MGWLFWERVVMGCGRMGLLEGGVLGELNWDGGGDGVESGESVRKDIVM